MDFGSLAALVKLVAAVAVAVPLTAYVLQDKLIFQTRPRSEQERQAIAARHPQVADIFLQAADGTRLHAWHFQAAPAAPRHRSRVAARRLPRLRLERRRAFRASARRRCARLA